MAMKEVAAQQASTIDLSVCETTCGEKVCREFVSFAIGASVKVSQLAENVEALVNLLARKLLQALGSKALAGV